MNKKIDKILKKIEKLENKWEYILTPKEDVERSFARTNKNKRIKFWSVPRTTGQFLRFLVLASKSKKILELGCSAGYSAIWMASAFNKNKGNVYTTEILKPKIELAKNFFIESGLSKQINLLEGDILKILKNWKGPKLDFIFIDAAKEEYCDYYKLAFPLLKSGGLIVADNVESHKHMLKKFIKKLKEDKRVVCQFVDVDNGLMLIYKK